MGSKYFTIIPSETKARDFKSRLAISLYLLKKNINVFIGEIGSIYFYIDLLPKSVFLEKSISVNKLDYLLKLKKNNHKIVNLDEEGFGSFDNPWVFLSTRINNQNLDKVDYYFAGNTNELNILKRKFPKYRNKILFTGNPRISLWRSEINFKYDEEFKFIKKFLKNKKFILISSNFGYPHFRGSNYLMDFARKQGVFKTKKNKINQLKENKYQKFMSKKFENLTKFLAKNTKYEIIFRPHPSESIVEWKEKFKNFKNIKVIFKFDASSWILRSKYFIQNGCLTGLEAFLRTKKVISYQPKFKIRKYKNRISNKFSRTFDKQRDILNFLENKNKEKLIIDKKELNILFPKTKFNYAKNIANIISKIVPKAKYTHRTNKLEEIKDFIINEIKNKIKQSKDLKEKKYSLKETNNMVKNLIENNKDFKNLNIKITNFKRNIFLMKNYDRN